MYLAYDSRFDQQVAIKLFRFTHTNLPLTALTENFKDLDSMRHMMKTRFISEAKLLRELSREPTIVDIFDFGLDIEGNPYYVMPYLHQNLRRLIGPDFVDVRNIRELSEGNRPRVFSVAQTLEIVRQLSSALAVVHRAGLVHRDIKPANILFDQNGELQLADFGIAKLPESELSNDGYVFGSREYMSPEQRESSKHVDTSSDVYSVGVILYRLVTGRMPVGRYLPPSAIVSTVPKALDELILSCLSIDPGKRPNDGSVLLNSLNKIRPSEDHDVADVTVIQESEIRHTGTVSQFAADFGKRLLQVLINDPRMTSDEFKAIAAEASVIGFSAAGFARLAARVRNEHRDIFKPLEALLVVMEETLDSCNGRIFANDIQKVLWAGQHTVWSQQDIEEKYRQLAKTNRRRHVSKRRRKFVLASLLVLFVGSSAVGISEYFTWKEYQAAEAWQNAVQTGQRSEVENFLIAWSDSHQAQEALKWLERDDHWKHEKDVWSKAKQLGTSIGYEDYLVQFPDGKFSEEAESIRQKLFAMENEEKEWQRVQKSTDLAEIEAFIARYPDGKFLSDAQYKAIAVKLIYRSGN